MITIAVIYILSSIVVFAMLRGMRYGSWYFSAIFEPNRDTLALLIMSLLWLPMIILALSIREKH